MPEPSIQPTTEAHPELLTIQEAGEYTNTSERFARRLVSEGRIDVVKVGKHVRIPRAALDAFIAQNTRQAVQR